MYYSFFKGVSFLGLGLTAVFSVILFFLKGWSWASGVLVGSLWVFLNSFFLYQLLEMGLHPALDTRNSQSFVKGGVHPKPKQNEKILIFSILKFPVLYIIGFFILRTRVFPVYSVLLGLTLYFVALGIMWVKFNARTTSHGDMLGNKV